jgi:hypothetical protein
VPKIETAASTPPGIPEWSQLELPEMRAPFLYFRLYLFAFFVVM